MQKRKHPATVTKYASSSAYASPTVSRCFASASASASASTSASGSAFASVGGSASTSARCLAIALHQPSSDQEESMDDELPLTREYLLSLGPNARVMKGRTSCK
ncbi:hypothetical protein DPMN_083755 [Dreissena polymorpha]|uniref:Uncharacterized protein n=1 Tax=Dreissena polymorpha TaxID=45954 RepID=A0A9D3Y9W0_DREPO|nr:hypothetical protein DPMN_083755 [Dreissena polymorpha]